MRPWLRAAFARLAAIRENRHTRASRAIDAKFSLPFTVATMLVHSSVTLDSFSARALEDSDVLALARLVEFEHRCDWGRNKSASGVVQIRFSGPCRMEWTI